MGDALNRGIDIATSNIYVYFGEEEEEKNMRTVIDDFDLVENTFTAKYLFVVNKIRQQAADLGPIDQKTYHLWKSLAGSEFDNSSVELKGEWDQRRRKQLREWGGLKDTLICELQNNNNNITYN